MEYPVCLADSCVGTLYVCPRGEETELRAVCRGTEKGLYRLYVQGNRGEVLLGVTEDGRAAALLFPGTACSRRRIAPRRAAAVRRRSAGTAWFLSRLPEMARTARQGRCVRAVVPWREGEPFPIPELFCFASVGQGRVTYLFDGEGRPIMPK